MEQELGRWAVVVPARLASTRLPRKPLADLCGKPLILRVFENLRPLAESGATVVVATDAAEVADVCQKNNVPCVMTSPKHESGTDRCFEAVSGIDLPYILNVQGDEPTVSLVALRTLMGVMEREAESDIGTLVYRSKEPSSYKDPNVVKAVGSYEGKALYFSRASIPFGRETLPAEFLQHIGVYAFRRQALQVFCQAGPGQLERIEKLEQLRALELGMTIRLVESAELSRGIDTPEDLERARQSWSG